MVNLIDMLESTSTTIAGRTESAAPQSEEVKTMIDVRDLTFAYGNHEVLHEVSLQIPPRAVTAFIGPSGCGKTTLLRCFNRMNDLVESAKISRGSIVIVTHNMQQAGRCSDHTAFFYLGRLIEFGETPRIFSNPTQRQTEDYITGRFG